MTTTQHWPGLGLKRMARQLQNEPRLDWIFVPLRRVVERPAMRSFERGERPSPPQSFKWSVISEYAARFGLKVLVETGTYLGDTLYAHRRSFDRLFSIELSPQLFSRAVDRFRRFEQIEVLQGDSSEVLPRVLAKIDRPALFWLDGHYSEGITAKGAKETPIREELDAIFAHPVREHVILIDDARCFTGANDYPTIAQIEAWVAKKRPGTSLTVENDIIRITPKQTHG